ncbi:MAG: Maf-like protein [Clostridium sp.]|nr:Maf-like protein [Clostridium sp.]
MLDNLKKYRLVLASQSPRRRELLGGLGVDYEVRLLPGIDESYPDTLQGEDIPLYIARTKAAAYLPSLQPDELLITADTIVWLDGCVLGKPRDEEDARRMLHALSGRTHQVMTGVSITGASVERSFVCTSEVTFDVLSDEEIDYYVGRFRPLDKAGSYGIQEWIGYIGVQSIRGSYFNIMGLPVQRLYRELRNL